MANMNRIAQEFLVESDESQIFSGMAFDGEFFYLLEQSGSKVAKYNRCFEFITDIVMEQNYSCICQDCEKGKFWAASKECPNLIFYLDKNFKRIKEIHILPPKNCRGYITGLSFNYRCKTVLVAHNWGVIEINPDTESFSMQYEIHQGVVNGVLSIYPGSLIIQTVSGRQSVLVLNPYQQVSQQQLPAGLVLRQIVYFPCKDEPVLYCLMTQNNGYTKIVTKRISYKILGFNIDPCYEETHNKNVQSKEVYKALEHPMEGEEDECQACSVKPMNFQDMVEDINRNSTFESSKTCQKVQIMESVAMTGAAISHILNAEGEKLQKVLACTNDINKILCVNREVSRTIIHVTHLEQALYDKLFLLENQCCNSHSNSCCNPCDKRCDPCCDLPCDPCCDLPCEPCCSQCSNRNNCSRWIKCNKCSSNCSNE